jgi:hypothetical protein
MLEVSQLLRQEPGVMVVDESDGADDESVRSHHGRTDQEVPNEVAKRFRAVFIPLLCNETVEAAK